MCTVRAWPTLICGGVLRAVSGTYGVVLVCIDHNRWILSAHVHECICVSSMASCHIASVLVETRLHGADIRVVFANLSLVSDELFIFFFFFQETLIVLPA